MLGSILSFLFLLSGDYDLSLRYSDYLPEYQKNYIKMICSHQLKQKDSIVYAKFILDDFSNQNKRYKVMAELILEDISKWGDNDLGDIGRDMNISKNRLNIGRVDKKTIQVQEEIIKKLDKMIEEKENPKIKNLPAESQSENPNSQPQIESVQSSDSGPGKVDEKILKKIENWGKLPDKERKDVMRQLELDVPAKFKAQVDEYNKALRRIK